MASQTDSFNHLFSNASQPTGSIDFIETDNAHICNKSAEAYTAERERIEFVEAESKSLLLCCISSGLISLRPKTP